ncbi:MAG: hypothetical protein HY921_09550 [Elusimicrobia bacterium]|nr:hypothetical protein [Elusimicrobiota bacterium]
MRAPALALVLPFLAASARASNLDVTAAYRLRALSYTNLDLSSANSSNKRSFIENDARLGFAVRKIALEDAAGAEEPSLDVAILLRALGVSGSTATLSAPFDRAAAIYPSSNFTPFFENAYIKANHLFGKNLEAVFGRQSYKLGSGLLLDDDGAGLTGIKAGGELPWGGLKLEGFVFQDKNPLFGAPNNLDLLGLSLSLPTDGLWQLSQLLERDRTVQTVFGCANTTWVGQNCMISKAMRSFTSLHYQMSYGPLVFDGELALERGAGTPTGGVPLANHVTYQGDAQVFKAKWKQNLPRLGEGIARLSVARASGDKPGTPTTDEAFFPTRGHRYNGLERGGFGDFFGASPYDAWGGNYAVSSGLNANASGILVAGGGFTPPAYKGVALDLDYFLFQADRIRAGPRNLGSEWDFRLRYQIQDRFTLSASAALFSVGSASNAAHGSAHKYALEASGRF